MANFGYIKDTFNKILSESLLCKDDNGKNLFKKYLQTIKEDTNLKQEYLIYKNLTTKKFESESDAKDYIKENIFLLKINDPTKGIEKLITILGDKDYIMENKEIYNHINILRNTIKTPSNLDKLQKSINFFKERMIKEETLKEDNDVDMSGLPPSVLTKLVVNKFNNKYKDIEEEEKVILKSILNGDDNIKEEKYVFLKNECIDMIDIRLVENTDLDVKDKLLKVKDKLLRMSYDKITYPADISNIYNLKQSVNE